MPIKYKAIETSQPGVKGGGKYKFYPRVHNREKIGLRDLARRISGNCTLHEADIYATMVALVEEIPDLLMENYSVELGDMGIFSLHISGEASETAEEVTAKKIKDVKIAFRPGKVMKDKLKKSEFTRRKK